MKICYIGDAESIHTKRWISWFAKKKRYDIHLITDRPSPIDGITMHTVPESRTFGSVFKEMIEVKKKVKKIQPDILHSHYASSYGIFGYYSKYHPFVISVWGSDVLVDPKKSFFVKTFLTRALNSADLVTCDGLNTFKEMKNELGITNDNIKIIFHGVDSEFFSPEYKNPNFSKDLFGKNCPVVTTVRLLKKKNDFSTFIKAVPLILKEIPEVKFIIGGKGEEEENLKNLANELDVSSSILFPGWIEHDKLAEYLASSDVYASTALWDGGISVVTLDAMSCETPVVTTDVANATQWIRDGENGFVIPVKNPEILAKKIIYLIRNKDVGRDFGKRTREIVKEKQSETSEMTKMEELYEGLIK